MNILLQNFTLNGYKCYKRYIGIKSKIFNRFNELIRIIYEKGLLTNLRSYYFCDIIMSKRGE